MSRAPSNLLEYKPSGPNAVLRQALWLNANSTCYWCRAIVEFRNSQIDHLFPHSGAIDDCNSWRRDHGLQPISSVNCVENLAIMCGSSCNNQKSARGHDSPYVAHEAKKAEKRADTIRRLADDLLNPENTMASLWTATTFSPSSEEEALEFLGAVTFLADVVSTRNNRPLAYAPRIRGKTQEPSGEFSQQWSYPHDLAASECLILLQRWFFVEPGQLMAAVSAVLEERVEESLLEAHQAEFDSMRTSFWVDATFDKTPEQNFEPSDLVVSSLEGEAWPHEGCMTVNVKGSMRSASYRSGTVTSGNDGGFEQWDTSAEVETQFIVELTYQQGNAKPIRSHVVSAECDPVGWFDWEVPEDF